MAHIISQREFRNHSGSVLQEAEAGEVFTVTRNGTPVAELRPLPKKSFVAKEELLGSAASLPPMDVQSFREELDELYDQEISRE